MGSAVMCEPNVKAAVQSLAGMQSCSSYLLQAPLSNFRWLLSKFKKELTQKGCILLLALLRIYELCPDLIVLSWG